MWEMIDEVERLNGSLLHWTERARVPGGWLVRHDWDELGDGHWLPSTMCFVPDPQHEWDPQAEEEAER